MEYSPCTTKDAINAVVKRGRIILARRQPQALDDVMRTSHDRRIITNEILLSMIETEFRSIRPHLEHVVLSSAQSLCEPQEFFKFAYFPNDGVISIVVVLSNGKTVEAGLVGKEGLAGLAAIDGYKRSPLREVVQISGNAFRVRVSTIRRVLASAPLFDRAVKHYSLLFGLQIAQTAACNRLHDIERRLARWLLMAEDRVDSGILHITHDFLATMLGTDRSSVSVAAASLQRMDIIQYRRGAMKVLKRQQLESFACECYQTIQNFDVNDELLPSARTQISVHMSITVLLADDMAMMRKAIRRLLEEEPGIEVVGEATDFAEALRMAKEIKPQIVVMDMHMPNEGSLTPWEINSSLASNGTRLLAISIWDDADTKAVAASFGAIKLLDKARLGIDLLPIIKSVAAI